MRVALLALLFVAELMICRVSGQLPSGSEKRSGTDAYSASVEKIATMIEETYFDSEVSAALGSSIRKRLESGSYSAIESESNFAKLITEDLQRESKDKHFFVGVRVALPEKGPSSDKPTSEKPADNRLIDVRRKNAGVQRLEVLPGNIGFINLTGFYRQEETKPVLNSVVGFLENVEGLIIDCRENGGGSPEGVVEWMSALCDEEPTEIFYVRNRSGATKRYSMDRNRYPNTSIARVPKWVLVSASTFSAGEGIAFLLKERGAATIVGEITAGAANPGRVYEVNDRFEIQIPNGQLRSTRTQCNWEGVGVVPELRCSSQEAVDVAFEDAMRQIKPSLQKPGE